ncbi:MoaF-related domain-containing protein [[Pseudomonas] boreopolis]|uniref:MoaF-related domain-containing protein n=1 Tax=Xanthomonas boreopolis TaxID=86183 RepID=UPI003D9FCC0A
MRLLARTLLSILLVASGSASAQSAPSPETETTGERFPAAGHVYRVDFGGGNAFDIAFDASRPEMTFTRLHAPDAGARETIRFTHRKLRDGLYLVYWQEADRTTVVHVEDFANGLIYTNIARPDGTFFNGQSHLTLVK